MSWPTGKQPFGVNRVPLLSGLASDGSNVEVPIAVDKLTGAVITESGSSGGDSINLIEVGGSPIALGQTTQSASLPVTIASDQTLPLPTGAATSANQTNGTQQTKITNGTNVADVLASGTPNSTGNAIMVGDTTYCPTFSVTSVSTGTAYDIGNYKWVSVQVSTLYTGTTPTVTFQQSNDNSTWVNLELINSSASGNVYSSTTTTPGIMHGALTSRYFRLNFTGAYSSGTTTGTIVFSVLGGVAHNSGANQIGTWNIATVSAVTAITNALPAGTNVIGHVITDTGSTTAVTGTVNTNLAPSGTALNTYEALLTTNATTTVTASTAYISSIVITTVTGQTGGTITITDGQGTPQTLVNGLSTVTAMLSPTTLDFSTPIKMTTGIKVITSSSVTAATVAVWINYYQ